MTLRATARAEAEAIPWLRSSFGTRLAIREQNAGDHVQIEIRSWSARSLAAELAGFGRWVEVLHPVEVREELARIGDELRERYAVRTP